MFASKTTRGFYDPVIHGSNMPIDITPESEWGITYTELMAGQEAGKTIDFNEAGHPFLNEPSPPEPTMEQLQAQANVEARAYLTSTDWYVIRQQETGQAIPEDILIARAEARASVVDIPVGV